MANSFSRSELILGHDAMQKLAAARVAVFGVGGVGGYVVEALARTGIGALDLIDNDTVCLTNLNRQIIATHDTIGKYKVDVFKERVHAINPDCKVATYKTFFLPETAGSFDFKNYDYVVDAIDTVAGKIAIIEKANEAGVPAISSMGAGNKTDPTAFKVADLYDTSVCPLAKVMRKECKKRALKNVKVVYSTEKAVKQKSAPDFDDVNPCRRSTPGSLSFVSSVAGLIIAGEVIKDVSGYVPEYDD